MYDPRRICGVMIRLDCTVSRHILIPDVLTHGWTHKQREALIARLHDAGVGETCDYGDVTCTFPETDLTEGQCKMTVYRAYQAVMEDIMKGDL